MKSAALTLVFLLALFVLGHTDHAEREKRDYLRTHECWPAGEVDGSPVFGCAGLDDDVVMWERR